MKKIKPGNDFEELVFNLLLNKKIPELRNGDFFQSDIRGLDNMTRPDLVHFYQVDEDKITMVPYDIKSSRTGIKPQQISPLTLKILDLNLGGPFHTRLMESLEENGWQNMRYQFKEGAMILKRVNEDYTLDDNLTFKISLSNEDQITKIRLFQAYQGNYVVDTMILEPSNNENYPIEDLDSIIRRVDWFNMKSPDNIEIICSASKVLNKPQKSKRIFIKRKGQYKRIDLCPYILVPPKYLKRIV